MTLLRDEEGLDAGGWIAITGTSADEGERRELADFDTGIGSSIVCVHADFISVALKRAETEVLLAVFAVEAESSGCQMVWLPVEIIDKDIGCGFFKARVCSTNI